MLHRPARLGRDIDYVGELDLRRHRHAVLDVAVALAKHLQIDGQHQRRAVRSLGACNQVGDEAAVADHIDLEPERPLGRFSDLLHRADRHRRHAERDAGLVRGFRCENFAVAMLHAAQPDRRERDRQRGLLPDDGGGEVALVDIHQHALAQLDALHVGSVGAEGLLGIGAGIDILKERARHALFGKLAQVFDAGDRRHRRIHPLVRRI